MALCAVLFLAGCGKEEVDRTLFGPWQSDGKEECVVHLIFYESGQYSVMYEFGERTTIKQKTNKQGMPMTGHISQALWSEGHGKYRAEGKTVVLEPLVGECEGEEGAIALMKRAHSKPVTIQRVPGSKPRRNWTPEEFMIANPKGGTFVVRDDLEVNGYRYIEDTMHWDTMNRKPGKTEGR